MCLAIMVPSGATFDDEWIVKSWDSNPDGAGIAYAKDGKVEIEKGIWSPEELILLIDERREECPDSDFLVHLRWANIGVVDDDNCHPFRLDSDLAFIHNGTISPCVPKKGSTETRSDTQLFAEFAKKLPENWVNNRGIIELVEDYIGYSKLVFIDGTGTATIYNELLGEYVGDVWMSNDYYTGDYERGAKGVKIKTAAAVARDFVETVEAEPVAFTNTGNATFTKLEDGSWVPSAYDKDDWEEDICEYCGAELTHEYEKIYGVCDKCSFGTFYGNFQDNN